MQPVPNICASFARHAGRHSGRHDVAVDFHLDFDLDPARSDLPTVIAETVARGWGGRVSVGHFTKLSAMSPEELAATGRRLADAGVAVTVLFDAASPAEAVAAIAQPLAGWKCGRPSFERPPPRILRDLAGARPA
jgi:hypothetical protein